MLRLLAATLIGAILVIYLEWPETDSPVRKPASVSEFLQSGTERDRKVDGMMDTSFMDPVTGMEFVLVRGGAFEMETPSVMVKRMKGLFMRWQ